MSETVVLALPAVIGLGLVCALLTRRPRSTLAGGFIGASALWLPYVLTVGEGAPFAPHTVRAGAMAGSVIWTGFAIGVAAANRLEPGEVVPSGGRDDGS